MSVQRLKVHLAPPLWRFLVATVRVGACAVDPLGNGKPVIYACLHRDILPAILYVRPTRPCLLISRSSDGEILIRCLQREGFAFVRGSSGVHGGSGFRGLLGELRGGRSLGVAVDGPRGPFGVVREGVVQLAARSGAPIIPLVARAKRSVTLATWDRTVIPIPFGKVDMQVGRPLYLARTATDRDLAGAREELQRILLATAERGDDSPLRQAAGTGE